jgi:hypothetical protein
MATAANIRFFPSMVDLLSRSQRYAVQASVISSFQNVIVFWSDECSFGGRIKDKEKFHFMSSKKKVWIPQTFWHENC